MDIRCRSRSRSKSTSICTETSAVCVKQNAPPIVGRFSLDFSATCVRTKSLTAKNAEKTREGREEQQRKGNESFLAVFARFPLRTLRPIQISLAGPRNPKPQSTLRNPSKVAKKRVNRFCAGSRNSLHNACGILSVRR